ncbi:MAG: hypothetical protein AB1523_14785 [Bacillota bacterium]
MALSEDGPEAKTPGESGVRARFQIAERRLKTNGTKSCFIIKLVSQRPEQAPAEAGRDRIKPISSMLSGSLIRKYLGFARFSFWNWTVSVTI